MKRELIVLVIIAMALVGIAGAANYMYEKATIKGVGYKNVEMIISTQGPDLSGLKLVEKESGSGNVILERTEVEADRAGPAPGCDEADCGGGKEYINFTKEAEFEYMPVSYQTGKYDQKWIEKLCVQNYKIGAVVTEMYTHAEHLQKMTEVKTKITNLGCSTCWCNGTLEANFNSQVIGVAHIGWLSKDPRVNDKGRHNEYGRSVEDLTGVFSIEKFIQLWDNNTCGAVSVDWLPCV